MAISNELLRRLQYAMGSLQAGSDLATEIENGGNPVADNVELMGSTDDLVGVDGSGSNAAPLVETEARLDAIEAKVDELISALIDAGLMSDS